MDEQVICETTDNGLLYLMPPHDTTNPTTTEDIDRVQAAQASVLAAMRFTTEVEDTHGLCFKNWHMTHNAMDALRTVPATKLLQIDLGQCLFVLPAPEYSRLVECLPLSCFCVTLPREHYALLDCVEKAAQEHGRGPGTEHRLMVEEAYASESDGSYNAMGLSPAEYAGMSDGYDDYGVDYDYGYEDDAGYGDEYE